MAYNKLAWKATTLELIAVFGPSILLISLFTVMVGGIKIYCDKLDREYYQRIEARFDSDVRNNNYSLVTCTDRNNNVTEYQAIRYTLGRYSSDSITIIDRNRKETVIVNVECIITENR